jgi:Ca-activated chloride channel family protein
LVEQSALKGTITMMTSLPEPLRPRPRMTDLAELTEPAAPVDQGRRGSGAEVVTADGRSLPLVSASLRGTARGGIARLVLEQRFENGCAETLHVTYRMPLPPDGAVSGYAFAIGDRTIAGRVVRKQEARERFEQAVAAGHTAALLEQERADLFTQSIGNLPAGQALIARITIDLRLTWLPEGEWELRFPTVIGPRYVAASDRAEDARGTEVVTAPGGVAARIRIAIAIDDTLSAGRTPSSPSHALTVGEDGAAELADPAGARLDRDLVLRWPVAGPTTGLSLAMMRPEQGDECFGMITLVPPAPAAVPRAFARDLIVLIDTSGSMAGRPLDRAKQVLALLIESLGDDDRLELIAFASEPRRYQPAPIAATGGAKRAAIDWLRGLSAGGGTEMRTAVVGALQLLRPGAQRQVVVATDGYIAGEEGLVAAVHAGLPAGCRLHFVGIGSSVNRAFGSALARVGRGAEVICDLDGDPERAVKQLLDRTRRPIATEVALEGSALVRCAPSAIPDVFAGAPLVVAVKLQAGDLVVRGQTVDGDWVCRLRVSTPRPGDGNPGIAALFGRERVADLEARRFAGERHDAEIERLGIVFQIATRHTAFVAIDDARTHRVANRAELVPQEVPYGTSAAAFGLRSPRASVAELLMTVAHSFMADDLVGSSASVDDPVEYADATSPIFGEPTVLGGPSVFDDDIEEVRESGAAVPPRPEDSSAALQRPVSPDVSYRRTPQRAKIMAAQGPASDLFVGSRIGPYEMIGRLGEGGMTRVFVARDLRVGRHVAIKVLEDIQPELTERLVAAARGIAGCRHDNLVTIHEVGEHGGAPYLVLEYLRGQPLSRLIENQKLPYTRAVAIVSSILRGLQCAHEHGIIHGDLEPDNVFVTDAGAIKVLDLGILQAMRSSHDAQAHIIRGTPPYMSPEQWDPSLAIDPLTDIWACGILLYCMICGRHPLDPLAGAQLRVTATRELPMPSMAGAAPADVPPRLIEIVDRCLRKDQAQRWQSAADLRAALDTLERSAPGGSPPDPAPSRR